MQIIVIPLTLGLQTLTIVKLDAEFKLPTLIGQVNVNLAAEFTPIILDGAMPTGITAEIIDASLPAEIR